jgi:hypothetical protein
MKVSINDDDGTLMLWSKDGVHSFETIRELRRWLEVYRLTCDLVVREVD